MREVQEDVLRRHRLTSGHQKIGQTLVESIVDAVALKRYKVPLCFREIDDDLEVIYNDALNALD